jgi:tetratricopeptide (TPR) repeat protein
MPVIRSTSYRFIFALGLAAAIAAVVTPRAAAKDKWVNLHTKNFNIVSNADEGATRQLASNLEQFRYVFSQLFSIKGVAPVPVTVIVFKSDGAFKPFKPLYNGKPSNIAGYFQRGEDENIIALNIAGNEQRSMSVIYHEYTHLLTSYTARPWPVWLLEGLAELYSTFEVDKNKVTLGMPVSNHVYFLREQKFVPLQTLFQVDHKSPIYNERDKQGVFYAESWALAHYLMFGDKSVRQPQLVEFVKLFNSGVDSNKAFSEAFKTDYAAMEKALRRYIGNDTYSGMNYFLKAMETQTEMTLQPLDEAEVQFYLGDLLLHTGRTDEAVAYFQQARTLDSNLARPYEGLGFVAMRHNDYEHAGENFKNAIARNSQNHLVHYYYAEALMRDAAGSGTGISPESSQAIIDELKKAIKLMPGFANSYHLMAEVYLGSGASLDESERALRTALQLDPQNKYFALTLAQIQLRQGAYDQAKRTLEPLLAPDADQNLKEPARSLMRLIETYSAAEAGSRSAGPPPARGTSLSSNTKEAPHLRKSDETTRPTTSGSDSNSTTPGATMEGAADSPSGATMKIEGTKIAAGTLAAIECQGTGLVLALRSNGKMLRFSVSDPAKLQFYSHDPDFHTDIGCGPINHAAFIHFKPVAATQSSFSGDAVAVEFSK